LLHELQVHQVELEMQNDELRRTQAALEAARARYFELYDLAPVGYVTLNEQGLILETNLTATTLLGVDRSALVMQPIARFIFLEDRDNYGRFLKKLFATGSPQCCNLRMLKGDGARLWVQLAVTVAQDAAGARVCRAVLDDLTERKQAEAEKEKLEAQNRQLQKAESLGRMAGAIAHHFNNQLQAVMMSLDLAMAKLPRDAELFASLTAALQSTCKASEVSTLMLTYLGQTHGKYGPLVLSETCRSHLSLLRAAMPRTVVLMTDLPSPGPVLHGNANELQQVLANLVTNAWEACGDRGGAIRLAVKTVAAADIPAVNRFPMDWQPRDPAYACLEVADEGGGIEPQDIDQLFDPFFSRKFTGRGMGLAVVLGILRAHGGVMTVASELGRGSVFRAFLPASAATVSQKPVPVARALPAAGGGTVLVVEDEPAVRHAALLALEYLGFAVLEAADGVEGVEVFQQHRDEIRCVLCDLTMPRMNGWETLITLRKLAPGIPVILASGYSEAQVMEGEHPEWPQAFLSKPYAFKALGEAMARALAPP
jgi:PAS domain S-box-containing protein